MKHFKIWWLKLPHCPSERTQLKEMTQKEWDIFANELSAFMEGELKEGTEDYNKVLNTLAERPYERELWLNIVREEINSEFKSKAPTPDAPAP